MKAEINNTTKAAFMALYLSAETEVPEEYQEDGWYINAVLTGICNGGHEADLQLIDNHDNACETETIVSIEQVVVKLKSVQSITDDDAIAVLEIIDKEFTNIEAKIKAGKYIANTGSYPYGYPIAEKWQAVFDFLRSRFYLVGFRGLSLDEIIAAGWAKLD